MAAIKSLGFDPSILKPPLGPEDKVPGQWQTEAWDFYHGKMCRNGKHD